MSVGDFNYFQNPYQTLADLVDQAYTEALRLRDEQEVAAEQQAEQVAASSEAKEEMEHIYSVLKDNETVYFRTYDEAKRYAAAIYGADYNFSVVEIVAVEASVEDRLHYDRQMLRDKLRTQLSEEEFRLLLQL